MLTRSGLGSAKAVAVRHMVPALPWLCSLLEAVGQQPADVLFQLGGKRRAGAVHNIAEPIAKAFVLLTTDGAQYQHGPLTNWSREAEVMLEYHHHPTDAYSLNVVEAFGCSELLTGFCKRGRGRSEVRMSYALPLCTPCWSEETGASPPTLRRPDGSQIAVQDVLEAAGLGKTWLQCFALLCPAPVVELILRGAWRELLFLTRWHPLSSHRQLKPWVPDWPPRACESVWSTGQLLREGSPVHASSCEELRKALLQWAPCILQAHPSQQVTLERHVSMLQSWALALKPRHGPQLGRLKHSAEKLIAVIKAADYVKNHTRLTEICDDLLPHLVGGVCQDIKAAHILPSKTQIRYYELAFDMAFMLTRRQT